MSKTTAKFPTVAEVLKHPAFQTATWNLEPTRSGRLPVAEGRGGPFNISWEVHGEGSIKLVFIVGLGSLKSAWQRQTLYFGHERGDKYSVLLLDNRGMGYSDVPIMRYSTSEMARDVAEVLAHVGWLSSQVSPLSGSPPPPSTNTGAPTPITTGQSQRQIHVAGLSLGGMIAQELAMLIPHAVSTLSLCCTAAEIVNNTGFFENMAARASLVIPKGVEVAVPTAARNIFPVPWLLSPDDAPLPEVGSAVTPRVGPPLPGLSPPGKNEKHPAGDGANDATTGGASPPTSYLRFPTNYHRFAAQEMRKRLDRAHFSTAGFLLQLIAAGWHRKTPAQLRALADAVGRERILVMHGTEDGMIGVEHGRVLIAALRPAVGLIEEGMGHAPIMERWWWFNGLMEERFAVGERLDGRA